MSAKFLNNLQLIAHDAPIKDRPWELAQDLRYFSKLLNQQIRVPTGYRTDFASVPRLFWRLFPPYGRYARATVVHDWLCDLLGKSGVDSKLAAAIFLEAMLAAGVPGWKAAIMYRAVRHFGPRFKAAHAVKHHS